MSRLDMSLKFVFIINNMQFLPHRRHCVPLQTSDLMLCRTENYVYTKRKIIRERNAEFETVKADDVFM
jgi:hypothetical protein